MFDNALYTAEQSKKIDQFIINHMKINGLNLMSKAAFACFFEIQKELCNRITVVCGMGNNVGDGLMLAAICHMSGINVTVYLCDLVERLTPDSRYMFDHAESIGVDIKQIENIDDSFIGSLSNSDLVVDAIFGTGVVNRDIHGVFEMVINCINQYSRNTLSVDVPSGICANTGKVFNVAILAQKTVTFICKKVGLYTGYAPNYTGVNVFAPLVNFPVEVGDIPVAEMLDKSVIAKYLALLPNKPIINKSDKGHLAIVAGDKGMFGAAVLAGMAALKSGAGRVSVFTHPDNDCSALNSVHPEIMCHKLYSAAELLKQQDKFNVIAIGCGLSAGLDWSEQIIPPILNIDKTMIIDAGALDFLKIGETAFSSPKIITPHEGEAARILNTNANCIRNDRIKAVKNLADTFNLSVLLKGCGNLIYTDNKLHLNPYGHNILATAGSGDLLTGIIGGLAAQLNSIEHASLLALLLQGLAAENYVKKYGHYGFTASMLLDEVILIMNNISYHDRA